MDNDTHTTKTMSISKETSNFKECQDTIHELMVKMKTDFPDHDIKPILMNCVNISKSLNELINKSIVGEDENN